MIAFAALVFALCMTQEPPPPAQDAIDVDALLVALHGDDPEAVLATIQSFARQSTAPAAIPRLLEAMRAEVPELDNEVGLSLDFILQAHPEAPCALEPLIEALRRPRWTSRQKCAQALVHLLRRGDGVERREELAGTLIPLLASQRPRVFLAAQRCLVALSGEDHGDVPDGWLAWHERTFEHALDMSKAVYEDLIVVQPRAEGGYAVEGQVLATVDELRALLLARKQAASERKLALGVSIQLANERLDDFAALIEAPDVAPLLTLLLRELEIADLVLSPQSDAFRAPWRAPT